MSAEQKFAEFTWTDNEEWLSYLRNLHPPPSASGVDKFKRKWFKSHVDDKLSLEKPSAASVPNAGNAVPNAGNAVPNAGNAVPKAGNAVPKAGNAVPKAGSSVPVSSLGLSTVVLQIISLCLLCCSFIANTRAFGLSLLCTSFVVDLYDKFGMPKWRAADFWQRVLMEDSAQALLMAFGGISVPGPVALLSPVLSTVMSLCFCVPNLTTNKLLIQRADLINSRRYFLMGLRANFEVLQGLLLVALIFVRKSTLMSIVLYWNLLRIKYQTNGFTKSTFVTLNSKFSRWLSHPIVPSSVLYAYTKMTDWVYNFANPQGN